MEKQIWISYSSALSFTTVHTHLAPKARISAVRSGSAPSLWWNPLPETVKHKKPEMIHKLGLAIGSKS